MIVAEELLHGEFTASRTVGMPTDYACAFGLDLRMIGAMATTYEERPTLWTEFVSLLNRIVTVRANQLLYFLFSHIERKTCERSTPGKCNRPNFD